MNDRLTVLLVDDAATLLRAIARAMSEPRIEIVTATSAQGALQVLAERRVHIIVSDLDMPEMDGIELLSRVRAAYPATIRMMLSGAVSLDRALRAINEGEVHHIFEKPVSVAKLRETILSFGARIERERRERERGEIVLDLGALEQKLLRADEYDALALLRADA